MLEIVVPVKKKELFYQYLLYLNPLLNLKEKERQVLAALLALKYTYRAQYSPKQLDELIFSENTYKMLAPKMQVSQKSLEKTIEALKIKQCLLKDPKSERITIHPNLLKFYQESKFKVTFSFVIQKEDEKETTVKKEEV